MNISLAFVRCSKINVIQKYAHVGLCQLVRLPIFYLLASLAEVNRITLPTKLLLSSADNPDVYQKLLLNLI